MFSSSSRDDLLATPHTASPGRGCSARPTPEPPLPAKHNHVWTLLASSERPSNTLLLARRVPVPPRQECEATWLPCVGQKAGNLKHLLSG